MSDKKTKTPPTLEWVLITEEDFRSAMPKMMSFRGLIQAALKARMGGRQLFSAFLSGKQDHIRMDSFFDAMQAMDMEVVVRPIRGAKSASRIEAIRAERAIRATMDADPFAGVAEQEQAAA